VTLEFRVLDIVDVDEFGATRKVYLDRQNVQPRLIRPVIEARGVSLAVKQIQEICTDLVHPVFGRYQELSGGVCTAVIL
jgi:hypothetical protein